MVSGTIAVIDFIDVFCSLFKRFIPKSLLKGMCRFVEKKYEEEAVESYYTDNSDIGFFELFILGSDESKKILTETKNLIRSVEKANWNAVRFRENSSVKEYIRSKKEQVVSVLKQKREVIKYLGKRISIYNEKLYQKINKIYIDLSLELLKRG
jgi:hypothetical protein